MSLWLSDPDRGWCPSVRICLFLSVEQAPATTKIKGLKERTPQPLQMHRIMSPLLSPFSGKCWTSIQLKGNVWETAGLCGRAERERMDSVSDFIHILYPYLTVIMQTLWRQLAEWGGRECHRWPYPKQTTQPILNKCQKNTLKHPVFDKWDSLYKVSRVRSRFSI